MSVPVWVEVLAEHRPSVQRSGSRECSIFSSPPPPCANSLPSWSWPASPSGQLNKYTENKETSADLVCMSLGNVPSGEQRTSFLVVGLAARVMSLDTSDCVTSLSCRYWPLWIQQQSCVDQSKHSFIKLCRRCQMGGTEPGVHGQLHWPAQWSADQDCGRRGDWRPYNTRTTTSIGSTACPCLTTPWSILPVSTMALLRNRWKIGRNCILTEQSRLVTISQSTVKIVLISFCFTEVREMNAGTRVERE